MDNTDALSEVGGGHVFNNLLREKAIGFRAAGSG